MQLDELFKLIRAIEPWATKHRDHICSEAARHDFAHCPKPPSCVYAWRVPAGGSIKATRQRAPALRS
jgi:hypothetical protein